MVSVGLPASPLEDQVYWDSCVLLQHVQHPTFWQQNKHPKHENPIILCLGRQGKGLLAPTLQCPEEPSASCEPHQDPLLELLLLFHLTRHGLCAVACRGMRIWAWSWQGQEV